MEKTVLGIFAHPDDAEFMCAGTLSLLKEAGWSIHIASLAMGDKGTATHDKEDIIKIRNAEAHKSAEIICGKYHCLGFEDLYILYNIESINKTTDLIRKIQPEIIITSSPTDYMLDHEITSQIVQTACFSAAILNMGVKEKPMDKVPYLYYSDSMQGKDKFGNCLLPTFYIDISSEINIKQKMLECHNSQKSWLLKQHKIDQYILFMKNFAEKRGEEISTKYAEGFRQHLGHGFPQENRLKMILGNLVLSMEGSEFPLKTSV